MMERGFDPKGVSRENLFRIVAGFETVDPEVVALHFPLNPQQGQAHWLDDEPYVFYDGLWLRRKSIQEMYKEIDQPYNIPE